MSAATRSKELAALSGPQKCAILCVALGPKGASRIFQQMSPDEVERISQEIASLPAVGQDLVQQVLDEFKTQSKDAQASTRGGADVARQILEEALGKTAARPYVERIQPTRGDEGLARLRRAEPQLLTAMLEREHPQTVAVLLAHMDALHAAQIVQALPAGLAADVLYRMARTERVPAGAMKRIEEALLANLDVALPTDRTKTGGPGAVARVLNMTDGTLEEELLRTIGDRDEELGKRIVALLFVFEDLLRIDNKGMQRVLREVETRDLALAMKATSEELKAHIKKAMSERAAAALEEEIELLGPVRVKEVDAAQARVLEVVRRLEDADEIIIQREGGSDDVVV